MTGLQSNLLPTTLPVRAHPAKATLAGTNGLSAQAAAPNGQSVTPMLTQEIRHYILGDLPTTPMANVVCSQCYGGLDDGRKCSAMPLNSVFASIGRSYPARCVICDLKSQEPSASTKPYCRFMTENPTIFHVVDYFERKMKALGFMELAARDDWTGAIVPGGRYFVTRNKSSLIVFTVGKTYVPGNGIAMIAGHIDALTAKLKPASARPVRAGYQELAVAPYAGGLDPTWWDRDLGLAGRVVVRDAQGKTTTRLVNINRPIAKIPTLAPHFGVGIMGTNNKETQAVPIIGLDNSDLLAGLTGVSGTSTTGQGKPLGPPGSFVSRQPPKLVKAVGEQLGIADYSQIVNWELELYDVTPATTFGLEGEFITAGRIDDKLCSWAAMMGLLEATTDDNDGTIRLCALFDDEEIGSLLRQGAKSNFLPSVNERIVEALCARQASSGSSTSFGPGLMGRTYARSFLLSADVTHAVNPNFLERYLQGHAPRLNVGVAMCADSNGHMTTDAVSTAILQRIAELSGCKLQTFMIRNDSRSGGTVGPTLSSLMGVKAADAGIPQLSMHSIRATTGALDPGLGKKFFRAFYERWQQVEAEWH